MCIRTCVDIHKILVYMSWDHGLYSLLHDFPNTSLFEVTVFRTHHLVWLHSFTDTVHSTDLLSLKFCILQRSSLLLYHQWPQYFSRFCVRFQILPPGKERQSSEFTWAFWMSHISFGNLLQVDSIAGVKGMLCGLWSITTLVTANIFSSSQWCYLSHYCHKQPKTTLIYGIFIQIGYFVPYKCKPRIGSSLIGQGTNITHPH